MLHTTNKQKYRDIYIYIYSKGRLASLARFVEQSLVKLYKNQSQVQSERGSERLFAFTCHTQAIS